MGWIIHFHICFNTLFVNLYSLISWYVYLVFVWRQGLILVSSPHFVSYSHFWIQVKLFLFSVCCSHACSKNAPLPTLYPMHAFCSYINMHIVVGLNHEFSFSWRRTVLHVVNCIPSHSVYKQVPSEILCQIGAPFLVEIFGHLFHYKFLLYIIAYKYKVMFRHY